MVQGVQWLSSTGTDCRATPGPRAAVRPTVSECFPPWIFSACCAAVITLRAWRLSASWGPAGLSWNPSSNMPIWYCPGTPQATRLYGTVLEPLKQPLNMVLRDLREVLNWITSQKVHLQNSSFDTSDYANTVSAFQP